MHDFRYILQEGFCDILTIFNLYTSIQYAKSPKSLKKKDFGLFIILEVQKEHFTKSLIYEMFFFILLFILICNLIDRICHSINLLVTVYHFLFIIWLFFLLFFDTDLPEWSSSIGTFFALTDHFLQ